MDAKVKRCFVPCCKNNSTNSNKLFFAVPKIPYVRAQWYDVINETTFPSSKTFCCEIHFNLEEDCINWQEFRLQGKTLKLKKDILPFKYLRHAKIEKQNKHLAPIERLQHECIVCTYRRQLPMKQLQASISLNLFPQKLPSSMSCNSLPISSTTSIQSSFEEPRLTYCNQTINLAKLHLRKEENICEENELSKFLSDSCLKKDQRDPQLRRCKSDSLLQLINMPKFKKKTLHHLNTQLKRPQDKSKPKCLRKLHLSEHKIELEIQNNYLENWSMIVNVGEPLDLQMKVHKRIYPRRLLKLKSDGDKNRHIFKKL